jgi:hypothetical protein
VAEGEETAAADEQDTINAAVEAEMQTLSRLNRIHPDKEDTFVLDFANMAEEIHDAFPPCYQATAFSEGADPNKLYDRVARIWYKKCYLFVDTITHA